MFFGNILRNAAKSIKNYYFFHMGIFTDKWKIENIILTYGHESQLSQMS